MDPAANRYRPGEGSTQRFLEQSALGAKWDVLRNEVLGLTEGRSSLVRPMAEALPWLLPEAHPAPRL